MCPPPCRVVDARPRHPTSVVIDARALHASPVRERNAPVWPPERDVRDDRLAFLAARDQLRRAASPWWLALLRILEAGGPRGTRGMAASPRARGFAAATRMDAEARSDRMRWLVVACDDLAQRLAPDERQRLRASGELPVWFLPEVLEQARVLRRQA
jgi:hypothetical protein